MRLRVRASLLTPFLALACATAAPAHAGRLATEISPYLLARDGDALAWWPWSAAAFDDARHARRLVFVLAGRARPATCGRGDGALLEHAGVVEVLRRRFVGVALDADERPDVADVLTTLPAALGQEPEAGEGALWAVLTDDGWPVAGGRVRDDEAWRADLAARLTALASAFEADAGDTRMRAGVALATLRQAQTSEPPLRALERAVVERALAGLRDAFDPTSGRFGGALHAPLRLLAAEAGMGHAGARRLLDPVIEKLTQAPPEACAEALFERAGRLRALTLAYALSGQARTRAAAQREADGLLALRDATGALRAAPHDDRVFVADNGWAIEALALSGVTLARPGDLAAARAAADALFACCGPASALRRVARAGQARGSALLIDYAALITGLLELEDASRDESLRTRAAHLADQALARFADPRGGLFDTDAAHEALPVRVRDGYDGLGLSAHGVMASALLRLAAATGEARWRALGEATLTSFLGDLQRAPRGLETLAVVAGELLGRAPAPLPSPAAQTSSARLTRGPLTLALSLPPRARPGEALGAQVTLSIAPGSSVNAHRPGAADLSGFSVTLLTPELRAGAPAYPVPSDVRRQFAAQSVSAYVGTARVELPLRVPREQAPGVLHVRLRVGFQTCGTRACAPPDSVVLVAPLEVAAP